MAEQKKDDAKVVLVTGASKGFGFAIATALSKEGNKVYGGSRSKPKDECSFTYVELDVTKPESVTKAIDTVVKAEGKIDILVNNAGIALPAESVQNTPMEDYRKIMEVNYFGLIDVTQKVIPVFLKNDKKGQIINVSSCISVVSIPFMSGYCATKAAVDRFTEALVNELSVTDIIVQLISPGPSDTEFDKEFTKKLGEQNEIYKPLLANMGKNSAEFRKQMTVPIESVATTVVKMVKREETDFRVYPPPSINQIKFLNAEFNNNYQQNVKFGANIIREPEKTDDAEKK